jgi:NAD(P)-dependent dehydrogenase (short-subunit alcohol dehydrogenase family)
MTEHWLIAGASGLVGNACVRRLAARPNAKVTGLSRRPPFQEFGAARLALGFEDRQAVEKAGAHLTDVTSAQLADFSMGSGDRAIRSPVILSEVKIRRAGFGEVLDAETMFSKWIDRYQAAGLLPAPG